MLKGNFGLKKDIVLVAHNAPFDIRFLLFEFEKANLPLPANLKGALETLSLFRKYIKGRDPASDNFKEDTICNFLTSKTIQNPHFADNEVNALCEALILPPFLSLVKTSVSPFSLFVENFENLKAKWNQPAPKRDELEDSNDDGDGGEENDEAGESFQDEGHFSDEDVSTESHRSASLQIPE